MEIERFKKLIRKGKCPLCNGLDTRGSRTRHFHMSNNHNCNICLDKRIEA